MSYKKKAKRMSPSEIRRKRDAMNPSMAGLWDFEPINLRWIWHPSRRINKRRRSKALKASRLAARRGKCLRESWTGTIGGKPRTSPLLRRSP